MCEGEEEVQKTLTTLEKGKYIILSKVQLTQYNHEIATKHHEIRMERAYPNIG